MPFSLPFAKYHALGNDYLVISPAAAPAWGDAPDPRTIRAVCHRNYGLGSDGILWGPRAGTAGRFGLRIFNPDGSEAEKSGNGLRIFAKYLHDTGQVGDAPFTIDTPGGVVTARVGDGGRVITVDMGRVTFSSAHIPVAGPEREVLLETLEAGGRAFTFSAASVGNPHCVIVEPGADEAFARRFGPALENHPLFPRRTNVQFAQVLDRANLRIEIWERGAGYTLASGSSSSAAASVAHRLGLVDRDVTVHMPGGRIGIAIGADWSIRMTGPATRVAEGVLHTECLGDFPEPLPGA